MKTRFLTLVALVAAVPVIAACGSATGSGGAGGHLSLVAYSTPKEAYAALIPAFDKTAHDPGYIKGYLPGVRENGAQYTHAALWTVLATALQGNGDRALAQLTKKFDRIDLDRTGLRVGLKGFQFRPPQLLILGVTQKRLKFRALHSVPGFLWHHITCL